MGDTSYNQVNALLCNRCVHTCVLACLCAGMCEPLYHCTPVTHMHTHTHTDAHPRTHALHTPTCTHPHTQPHTLTDTHTPNHTHSQTPTHSTTHAHTHRQCETPVEPTCYCIPGSLHSSHSHMLISSPPRRSAMHTYTVHLPHMSMYTVYTFLYSNSPYKYSPQPCTIQRHTHWEDMM